MKTEKITGEQVLLLQTYQAARAKKNEGTREEKDGRKALDAAIPALAKKLYEVSLMFNGAPAAIFPALLICLLVVGVNLAVDWLAGGSDRYMSEELR